MLMTVPVMTTVKKSIPRSECAGKNGDFHSSIHLNLDLKRNLKQVSFSIFAANVIAGNFKNIGIYKNDSFLSFSKSFVNVESIDNYHIL